MEPQTSFHCSLTVRQENFCKIYFSSGKIIAVHVTFYLNSSITEVLLAAHVSWHVPHLDNCFDICHTSLNWQMLPACAPPTPANKSQHKLKHSTFYCSFMEVLEFIVFLFCKLHCKILLLANIVTDSQNTQIPNRKPGPWSFNENKWIFSHLWWSVTREISY